MSDNRIPLNIWIERFKNAEFENENTKIQIEAGWYDWFCKDTSLKNKTKKMGNIIKQIKAGCKINLNETFYFYSIIKLPLLPILVFSSVGILARKKPPFGNGSPPPVQRC